MTHKEVINNPGGVRHNYGRCYRGQSPFQGDTKLVTFVSAEFGIGAICTILREYHRAGLNTVRQIVNRFAPGAECNVQDYIDAVCDRCGTSPDETLDVERMLVQLIKAIIYRANTACPYSDQQIESGISLASTPNLN